MKFTYEKFTELTGLVKFLGEQLEKIEQGQQTSNEVDTMAYQLICIGNNIRNRIKEDNAKESA